MVDLTETSHKPGSILLIVMLTLNVSIVCDLSYPNAKKSSGNKSNEKRSSSTPIGKPTLFISL